ncbi:PucR family transcriptional regulator [Streptomyces sp. CA-249302]|uniref:PucR family transcriptional regulator n=1 Tax=Streptomyces sp. CA-249302 TaxID=3240058 RepID=UPI003D94F2B7
MGRAAVRNGELGAIVSFLSLHGREVVERLSAAADRSVPAHARIAGPQRTEYEDLLRALWSQLVEAFRDDKDCLEAGTRPLCEVTRILADHAFTGGEVLQVVRVGLKTACEYVLEQSPPELVVGLMAFVSYCQPAVRSLSHGAVAGYHRHLMERGQAASPHETVGQDLVCGNVADTGVAELGPARFTPSTVLFLSCRCHSGEGAKHTWRRVAKGLEAEDVFWALVGDDLALVVPGRLGKRAADQLHRRVAQESDTAFWSLLSPPVGATEIQTVTRECQASLASLRRLGYPAQCYELRSLLFERIVLSADPGTLDQAIELIQRVTTDTKLADTLTAWIACHSHRVETACSLGIHPRTLDYRLRRIRTLVGLDPTESSAMSLLRCASIAWLADSAPPSRPNRPTRKGAPS